MSGRALRRERFHPYARGQTRRVHAPGVSFTGHSRFFFFCTGVHDINDLLRRVHVDTLYGRRRKCRCEKKNYLSRIRLKKDI